MRRGLSAAVLAACLAVFAMSAAAKPADATTYQITFGASDFAPAGAPTPFVLGQIDVTFDPAAASGTLVNGTATLDFMNFNVTNVGYSYDGFQDGLIIGGLVYPGDIANGISPGQGHDDFMLFINSFSTAPSFGAMVYFSMADPLHFYTSHLGAVHVDVVPAAVAATTPIPGALPLFASALGGLGFVGWARRKA